MAIASVDQLFLGEILGFDQKIVLIGLTSQNRLDVCRDLHVPVSTYESVSFALL